MTRVSSARIAVTKHKCYIQETYCACFSPVARPALLQALQYSKSTRNTFDSVPAPLSDHRRISKIIVSRHVSQIPPHASNRHCRNTSIPVLCTEGLDSTRKNIFIEENKMESAFSPVNTRLGKIRITASAWSSCGELSKGVHQKVYMTISSNRVLHPPQKPAHKKGD